MSYEAIENAKRDAIREASRQLTDTFREMFPLAGAEELPTTACQIKGFLRKRIEYEIAEGTFHFTAEIVRVLCEVSPPKTHVVDMARIVVEEAKKYRAAHDDLQTLKELRASHNQMVLSMQQIAKLLGCNHTNNVEGRAKLVRCLEETLDAKDQELRKIVADHNESCEKMRNAAAELMNRLADAMSLPADDDLRNHYPLLIDKVAEHIKRLEDAAYRRIEDGQFGILARYKLAHAVGIPEEKVSDYSTMKLVELVLAKIPTAKIFALAKAAVEFADQNNRLDSATFVSVNGVDVSYGDMRDMLAKIPTEAANA